MRLDVIPFDRGLAAPYGWLERIVDVGVILVAGVVLLGFGLLREGCRRLCR